LTANASAKSPSKIFLRQAAISAQLREAGKVFSCARSKEQPIAQLTSTMNIASFDGCTAIPNTDGHFILDCEHDGVIKMILILRKTLLAVSTAAIVAASSGAAFAEGKIRILEQFGISYLPLHIIKEKDLIAKYGEAQGIKITTEWTKVGGGADANDALLSGSVDVVSAGLGPLLTIWDRTRGAADVRGIAALADINFALLTTNPNVKRLEDFSAQDKIAVPSVTVSVQARALQLAAAKAFGKDNYKKLDSLTVSLPHPDAAQALLSKSGVINAHFSNAPYQQQALKVPGIHKVTDWYTILGGPTTSVTLYTTAKYRKDNPKTYAAFLAAFDEATAFIKKDPEAAVDIFIKQDKSKLDRAFLLDIVKDPDVSFGATPRNTQAFANFLHDVGALKNKPASWRDFFFDDIYTRPGS
jgi:NitT/TauT family transport system substrate-binding protein